MNTRARGASCINCVFREQSFNVGLRGISLTHSSSSELFAVRIRVYARKCTIYSAMHLCNQRVMSKRAWHVPLSAWRVTWVTWHRDRGEGAEVTNMIFVWVMPRLFITTPRFLLSLSHLSNLKSLRRCMAWGCLKCFELSKNVEQWDVMGAGALSRCPRLARPHHSCLGSQHMASVQHLSSLRRLSVGQWSVQR